MKKLINAPADVVTDMLNGLIALHPDLALLSEHHVLFRSDIQTVRDRQVSIISGGGSGHEPAHGGYVGSGMLSAAVAGEVFTSPAPDAVLAAIRQVGGAPGVLLIVKNYTGDRLNFGLAAEMARSQGISVETVTVADDVALRGSDAHAGARGLAGTVLVHKIAGAAAQLGWSLREVADVAQSAADHLATLGLSLSAGTVPAVGRPSYLLADDEVELGLGIHGEPGVRRMPLQSADALAEHMVQTIASAAQLHTGQRIAVLVNNLGATTAMELAIFGGHSVRMLQSLGMTIERVYSGPFVTSLDAAGVSLSILSIDDDRLALLDAPTRAPAWPNVTNKAVGSISERVLLPDRARAPRERIQAKVNPVLSAAIEAACDALIAAEERLTELDQASGDGDLGINLARGARAIKSRLPEYPLNDVVPTLRTLASEFQAVVGGSSGPLYGVMLLRCARSLEARAEKDLNSWAQAISDACAAVADLGDARVGDRTMLDALVPFASEIGAASQRAAPLSEALESAMRVAEAAAESTSSMLPRRGRASYLGARVIGHPDPGAIAVVIWLSAIQRSMPRNL